MKRMITTVLSFVLLISCLMVSTAMAEEKESSEASSPAHIDVDLSACNRAITYAQMLQILRTPEAFEGSLIRLNGKFNYAQTQKLAKLIVSDTAGCCELVLPLQPVQTLFYPDDFPPLYTDIQVTGCLTIDHDDPENPVYLADAAMEWNRADSKK